MSLKASNARQGIKTRWLQYRRNHHHKRLKASNARQGIKTPGKTYEVLELGQV